jgi:hypothetical protein
MQRSPLVKLRERKIKQLLLEDITTVKNNFYRWFLVLWKPCPFLPFELTCAIHYFLVKKTITTNFGKKNQYMRLSEIYFSSEIFYTYLNLLCINKCMYFYIHKYVYFKVIIPNRLPILFEHCLNGLKTQQFIVIDFITMLTFCLRSLLHYK